MSVPEQRLLEAIRGFVADEVKSAASEIIRRELNGQVSEAVRHHSYPQRLPTSQAVEYSGLTRRQLQRAVERGDLSCIPGSRGRGNETTYFRDELRAYCDDS